ncbi:MAG TPA: type VI immunity family protein [Actinomycetes bacterium]|nr:type VI immunity family protein [Actinomycetes bacterium]
MHALLRFADVPAGAATLACSVQLGALPGGRIGTDLAQSTQRWLVATAEGLGAETGYVALDVADAYDAASSWELAVGAGSSEREVTRTVWGYGWCTLLSPAHLMRLGGAERLAQVPGAVVLVGPDNRVLVRLGEDAAAVTAAQLAALREALRPVLPTGSRSLADYRAMLASDPYVVSPEYLL